MILALDMVFGFGFLERDLPEPLLMLLLLLLANTDAPILVPGWLEFSFDVELDAVIMAEFADTNGIWGPLLIVSGTDMLLVNVNDIGNDSEEGTGVVVELGLLTSEDSSMDGEGAPSLPVLSSSNRNDELE